MVHKSDVSLYLTSTLPVTQYRTTDCRIYLPKKRSYFLYTWFNSVSGHIMHLPGSRSLTPCSSSWTSFWLVTISTVSLFHKAPAFPRFPFEGRGPAPCLHVVSGFGFLSCLFYVLRLFMLINQFCILLCIPVHVVLSPHTQYTIYMMWKLH